MKTYCRRMDISDENFIRKYIAAFIYDKLENGNMPSIFAYYGSISKNEARRRLENSPEFVASVIDQIAYEMSWHLKTRTVREHIYMVVPEEKLVKNVDIVDGMSGKIRTLGLEKMIMQLYEVLAKEAAGELWTAKVGLFQVASIPGRGQAYGKKYIERWMSRDSEGTKYCVQSDIKKCYPSMSHDKILEFLRRDLGKSDMLLYLFETLIGLYSEAKVQNKEKDCKHGIFIGSPVSKDLCNYYLSYLYHYCTNELYEMKTRRGKTTRKRLIYHIMIQMDDIILFGSNKKDLHKAMLLVIEFVKSTLCLKIKDSWSLFRTGYVDRNGKQKGRDLDYMPTTGDWVPCVITPFNTALIHWPNSFLHVQEFFLLPTLLLKNQFSGHTRYSISVDSSVRHLIYSGTSDSSRAYILRIQDRISCKPSSLQQVSWL